MSIPIQLVVLWMSLCAVGILSQLTLLRLAQRRIRVTDAREQRRAGRVVHNHRFTASVRVVAFLLFELLGALQLTHRSNPVIGGWIVTAGVAGFVVNGLSELLLRELLLHDMRAELTVNGKSPPPLARSDSSQ